MKKIYLLMCLITACLGLRGYAAVIYVNHAATGNNNGTSWTSAYTSLQTAITAAVSGDQIWVAKGTYKPSSAYSLTNTSRYYHFEMKEGVAIYGGFAGTETTTADRTSFGVEQTNETILSGDVGTVGNNNDNCTHVIYNPATLALTNNAVIDGFTITGGRAYTSPSHTFGGGMYNCSSSPTLVNITFISNEANFGGAIYNLNSSPRLINVAIISNSAGYGGGIYNSSSSPTLINVTIAANTALGDGGGVYNKTSAPVFSNSILWGNIATNPTATAKQLYIESGTITLHYSCYANGTGDIYNPGTLTTSDNNITSNPLFYNQTGNDCRLTANSPCLDAGNDSYNTLNFDIRGKGYSRKLLKINATLTGTIDMGAYEYRAGECTTKKIYVNASAGGSNNGTTWSNAYTSLQTAIVNANYGDIIWVAAGTYKPSSANSLGITTNSRYYHFEMKEGVAIYGGFAGTETSDYDLSLRDFTINTTTLSGDINTIDDSTDNCYHIIYNPGALTSAAILDGFTITKGVANGNEGYHCYGGGICNCANTAPTFSNVVIVSNHGNNGGGMFNYKGSSPILNNVSFISNHANFGAGMYNWNNCSPILTNTKFSENTAEIQGGGIFDFVNSSPQLMNVVLASNTAYQGGGMYHQSSSSIELTNVTIASNRAVAVSGSSSSPASGGIYCISSATFNNCIIWGNTASIGNQMSIGSGCTVIMNHSCYSNTTNDISNSGTFTATNNNITTNPIFADAANGDFRIKKVSPCVNAGYNDYNNLTTDIRGAGYDRKIGTIDMGAYEYNSSSDTDVDVVIKYVNASAAGGNNGTSWADAYTSLQTALENANPGDQIWVAKGTYKPSSAYDLPNPTHVIDPTIDPTRYYHFRMKADVAIYGGFAGNEARSYDLSLRDFTTNETILSGDIGTEKDSSDNCCHVIYNPESSTLTGTAVLDGFTVTGGYANGNYPHREGAGMYNNNCSPTISNVIFFDNKTSNKSGSGGGMYNEKSSPRLINVAFTSNKSVSGGGMCNIESSPTLVNVSFTKNGAEYAGGGLYSEHGSVDLTNCTFIKNETYLYCGIGSYGGGMYHNSDLLPTLNNVTFNLNKSYKGGGLFFSGKSTVLNNCIIWGNVSYVSGDDIYLSEGVATLNHSCYSNSDNDLYTEEGASFAFDENCITTDPKFINVTKGDCRIDDESPCINKGSNSYNSTSTDIRGQARIQNSTIDMGAYEWTDGIDYICTNPTDGGEISSDQSICLGKIPAKIVSLSAPTGNKGTLEYQWQSSTTSETKGYSDIVGANDETYTPGKLSETTWFRRLARASCMDNWDEAIASNVVTVEVVIVTNPYLAVENNVFTYDGTAKTVVVNINDDEKIEWYDDDFNFYTNLSGTNAGVYSLYPVVTNVDHGCFIDNFKAISLTINTAEVKVTPDTTLSKAYGEVDPVLTYTYTPELATGNVFSGVLARGTGESAGSYAITMGTLSAGKNYTITLADADFTITPKAITVTPDPNQSKVYGDSDPVYTYSVNTSLIGNDQITGTLSREEGENVGAYAFSIGTLSAGDNYAITMADTIFTITAKSITVTPDAKQLKVYGDSDPILTYIYTPELIGGDGFTGALSRNSGEDVGYYTITAGSLSAGANYAITLANVDFNITAKPITVTANANQSKVYGESDPAFTYSVTPALLGGDVLTGDLTRAIGEDVGTYAFSIGSLSAGNNYSIAFVDTDFTITQKPINVIPNANLSKVFGETDPVFTYSVNPTLIGNDKITGTLGRAAGENVGTYAFSRGTLDVGANYTLTLANADFTILPKPITITPDAKSKEFGEVDSELSYTLNPSLQGSDKITGTLSREAGENVGAYNIFMGTIDAGDNYELTLADVDFTIIPKPVHVFADLAITKVYGDVDPVFTYTSTSSMNDVTFTGTLSRVSGENTGLYNIEVGTLSAGSNYSIVFTSALFEITAKQLTISDPTLTTAKQYDGTTIATVMAGTLSGVLASDEGKVTVTALANYSDATIGYNKTITVMYQLDGTASGNYLAPSNYTTNTGSISDKITLTGLTSLSGCEGGSFNLSYRVLTGEPVEYQILFNDSAIAAGFTNISYIAIPASSGSGSLTINIPEDLANGRYSAQLQVRNAVGTESELFPFSFLIDLSSDYLKDKFDDVVLCDNSSNRFTAYQWFKNDVPVNGATGQFYCDPNGLNGSYFVQVITTNGETLKTCPATYYNTGNKKAALTVSPNPVVSGQTFTIEISGVDEDDLRGSVLHVYNILGSKVFTLNKVKVLNHLSINGQYGNYIVHLTTPEGKKLEGKIIITK
jgi:hypothetical protein